MPVLDSKLDLAMRLKHLRQQYYFGCLGLLLACSGDPTSPSGQGAAGTGVQADGGALIKAGDLPEPCPKWQERAKPAPALPQALTGESYTVELSRWGILNDGSDPTATTEGFNEMLKWAAENNYSHILVPAGEYLVGVKSSDIYSGGIVIPSKMIFELDKDAVIRMAPNDTWNYCILAVRGAEDVTIRGGSIVGDRAQHQFDVTNGEADADDEGHAICIEGNSERILVEETELAQVTGDGVLIVGSGDAGASCFDITIRKSKIHDNRRQGVSIVGGVRVLIEDNDIERINGTSPQFGVDIESLKFKSADILIDNNRFSMNAGGDYVNTDGTNVWFTNNSCSQEGLTEKQSDGPIVHWGKTDQIIRGNTITLTVGSSNGLWGIIGYSNAEGSRGENTQPNLIEDNQLIGGGIHMDKTSGFIVRNNTLQDGIILGDNIQCLRLANNQIDDVAKENKEHYKFRNVSGLASGNTRNQTPIEFTMADDMPYTNSPPHLW